MIMPVLPGPQCGADSGSKKGLVCAFLAANDA
jgi:hypothetical protein